MKKMGSALRGPSPATFHRSSWPAGVTASALGGVADLDAAPSHRSHVRRQVIALHADVAESPAPGQELDEAGLRTAGAGRRVLAAITHAQQLQIVFLMKGDGVVGAPAGMGPAGIDLESDARVGIDTPLQVGYADHDVVDAGKHDHSSARVWYACSPFTVSERRHDRRPAFHYNPR